MATKLNNAANPTAHVNGAQPPHASTEPNVVDGAIFAAIRDGFAAINKLTTAKDDATAKVASGRIATYLKLAATAYDGDWSNEDIAAQVTVLRASNNKQYLSDVTKVTDKAVRMHVPAFFKLAKDAFAEDSETMTKAHRRQVFYVLNYLLPEAKAERPVPANVEEAIAAAKGRAFGVEAMLKADHATLKRYAVALAEMHKRYEGSKLSEVSVTLAAITEPDLKRMHEKFMLSEAQHHEQLTTVVNAKADRVQAAAKRNHAPGSETTALPIAAVPAALPGAVDLESLMAGFATGMTAMQQQIAALMTMQQPKPRK